jgi:hypothetical protein
MAKKTEIQVNRTAKGTQSFTHDLFKTDVQNVTKNFSFRTYAAQHELVPTPHAHIIHSHTSDGKPQSKTAPMAGHFHELKFTDENGNLLLDQNGKPRCEVGPAMRMVETKAPNGKKIKKAEPVSFFLENGTLVTDSHTHKSIYIESEELSPNKVQQMKRQNATAIMGAFEGAPKAQGASPEQVKVDGQAAISE